MTERHASIFIRFIVLSLVIPAACTNPPIVSPPALSAIISAASGDVTSTFMTSKPLASASPKSDDGWSTTITRYLSERRSATLRPIPRAPPVTTQRGVGGGEGGDATLTDWPLTYAQPSPVKNRGGSSPGGDTTRFTVEPRGPSSLLRERTVPSMIEIWSGEAEEAT
eukprot:CAMPEP_0182479876 /NCGR_PEP_ID=MMETSP1319-20130603/34918_1 /TAXON_ID=172717 /ORGANISM="Bolidomonas pacifica, Strain RCC208" /LENGTH=166 /DNA_ID=CAMNT_0024681325 /DNA_START=334 /DNA_END=834 /DNA_ORIENTATION=-